MAKKYNQSEEAKKGFKSSMLAYMMLDPHRVYTKGELAAHFEISERAVRAELERIANYYPIRATAGKKGYSILCIESDATNEELRKVNDDAWNQICELENRIDSLKARMKPLYAIMYESARKLEERTPKEDFCE